MSHPGYPQQPYGQQPPYPQQGYPPPQPQGGYYPPPNAPYGAPSPQPSPYGQQPNYPPPAQGYQQGHQQGYPPQGYPPQGYPPQQPPQPGGYPPPSAGYPPPQQQPFPQGGGYTQPSPGYDPNFVPPTDMSTQAHSLYRSMKGLGTNEKLLIDVLTSVPDAPHMVKLRHTYDNTFDPQSKCAPSRLLKDLKGETSGWFREGVMALARGPLLQDAYLVREAVRGIGTKEALLDEVLVGRSNADVRAIAQCYRHAEHRDLAQDVRGDLSLQTERLFGYVLEARRREESVSVQPHEAAGMAERLQMATTGPTADKDVVCREMAYASDALLRAMADAYAQRFGQDFDAVLKRKTSGHMQNALRLMLARARDPIKAMAEGLEDSMKGLGTKDQLLVNRMVKAHWDRETMRRVKEAYGKLYPNKKQPGQELKHRVEGETSGDYKKLLVALCK